MKKKFKVIFHGHGFDLDKDLSKETKDRVEKEFMQMYDIFAMMANGLQNKINKIWENYEEIMITSKSIRDNSGVISSRLAMGIDIYNDEYTYNDWCERWYKDVCKAVDKIAVVNGFLLRSNIFRDDDIPLFGVKFKEHPEWTMDFTVEPVD